MKLRTVRITNFRSIEDSTTFSVGAVTCLVGKNESGKSNVLLALERLKPFETTRNGRNNTRFDQLVDYPRRLLADYATRHPDGPAPVVDTEWELEAEDRAVIAAEFGEAALAPDRPVRITKHYGQEHPLWSLPFDTQKALKHLIAKAGVGDTTRQALEKLRSGEEMLKHHPAAGPRDRSQAALLERIASYRGHEPLLKAIDLLSPRLPSFLYFSHYDRMPGMMSIEALQNKLAHRQPLDQGENVFLAFLAYAGATIEELTTARRFEELNYRCEAASNKITDQIFKYWSQNQNLAIEFEIASGRPDDPPPFNSGTVMHARIGNTVHRISMPFSEHSAGFVWFFSFLIYFSQVTKRIGNVVILLDEPGLTLHGTAQRDLQRFIHEQLAPEHQVIFTTHSPFMVPLDDLQSVRTVEDVVAYPEPGQPPRPVVHGTRVGSELLGVDPATLFPLRAALGYDVTRRLGGGEPTLLVEGPADLLYLRAVSERLAEQDRAGLDARWVLYPSGGLDRIAACLALFGGGGGHVAMLCGLGAGDADPERRRRAQLLRSGRILTAAEFCEAQTEADVEDLFERALFAELVNSAYGLTGERRLTADTLDAAEPNTARAARKAAACLAALTPDGAAFSRYRPAQWLIENPGFLRREEDMIARTLDRFERLFAALNALL